MPSFEVRYTGSPIEILEDPQRDPGTNGPDDKGAPSRLNPSGTRSMYHAKFPVGFEFLIMACRVDGVDAPTDAELDGSLFTYAFTEWPGSDSIAPPALSAPPGQSSVFSFIPQNAGHYTLVVYRGWGDRGRVFVHMSVED